MLKWCGVQAVGREASIILVLVLDIGGAGIQGHSTELREVLMNGF